MKVDIRKDATKVRFFLYIAKNGGKKRNISIFANYSDNYNTFVSLIVFYE